VGSYTFVVFTLVLCALARGVEGPHSPDLSVGLEPVTERGLDRPVYVTQVPDGSGRLFIVEQPGRIRIVQDGRLMPRPFLDISSHVLSTGYEQVCWAWRFIRATGPTVAIS
jgi:hypothetical protein